MAHINEIIFWLMLGIMIVFFFFYGRYKFRVAREWKERDDERIKRIQETGKYELPEKPYW